MGKSEWNDAVLIAACGDVARTPKNTLWRCIKYFTISMAVLCPTTAIMEYFEISNIITFYIGALAGAVFILYLHNQDLKMYHEFLDKKAHDIATKWEQEQINAGK